ncbi:hypothetical protein NKI36_02835 [Mesorhizobium caraganae]|uniref:DUF982 domain-containing protein n=1 Tax=Mesorhizobium caraganae TaxID=483206 RepID=A0ABV1YU12_9HYPH
MACEIQQQWPSQIPIDGLDILLADIGCKPTQRRDQALSFAAAIGKAGYA